MVSTITPYDIDDFYFIFILSYYGCMFCIIVYINSSLYFMKSFVFFKKWLHIPIQPNQCNQCVYCINLVQDNVSLPYWVCASVCLSLYICLYFIFSIILLRWNMYNIYINCNSNSNHIKKSSCRTATLRRFVGNDE